MPYNDHTEQEVRNRLNLLEAESRVQVEGFGINAKLEDIPRGLLRKFVGIYSTI